MHFFFLKAKQARTKGRFKNPEGLGQLLRFKTAYLLRLLRTESKANTAGGFGDFKTAGCLSTTSLPLRSGIVKKKQSVIVRADYDALLLFETSAECTKCAPYGVRRKHLHFVLVQAKKANSVRICEAMHEVQVHCFANPYGVRSKKQFKPLRLLPTESEANFLRSFS